MKKEKKETNNFTVVNGDELDPIDLSSLSSRRATQLLATCDKFLDNSRLSVRAKMMLNSTRERLAQCVAEHEAKMLSN